MATKKKTPPPKTADKGGGFLVVQPSVRASRDWTPGLIRAAEIAADRGDLSLAAELCDALLGDDRVSSVMRTRVRSLFGLPLTFEAGGGDGRKRRKAVKALEAEEDFFQMFPEADFGALLTWGDLLGVGLAGLPWRENDAGRLVAPLDVWHPSHLRYNCETRTWTVKTGHDGQTERKVAPGDGTWILHLPYGASRPWASGLWRAIAPWYLLKRYARQDLMRHSEVGAIRVITTPEGAIKDLRKELASVIESMGRDGSIVLPPGFDLKLVEATASTRELYGAQVDMANTAIAVLCLGHNLTSEVKGGSYAAALVGEGVLVGIVAALAEVASTTAHDQALTWWAEFNFGDRGVAPWPLRDAHPPEDKKVKADVLVSLSQALPALHDAGADTREILESFDVPLRPEDEKPPAPPAGPPAPPPGDPPPPDDGGEGGPPPADDGGDTERPPPEDGGPGVARAGGVARALLGADAREIAHAVEAQMYVDQVADAALEEARAAVAPDVRAILREIEAGSSFEDVRRRILAMYRDAAPPGRLANATARAIVLSELAGREGVRREATEDLPN